MFSEKKGSSLLVKLKLTDMFMVYINTSTDFQHSGHSLNVLFFYMYLSSILLSKAQ